MHIELCNAVFDFEAWTTVWELNTWNSSGAGWHDQRYQHHSILLVRKQQPGWSEEQVVREAKASFEAAATEFFVKTLETCRAMRPRARWGFYGLPLGRVDPSDPSATTHSRRLSPCERKRARRLPQGVWRPRRHVASSVTRAACGRRS